MIACTSYAARSSLPEAAEEERDARAVMAVAPPSRASCRDAAAWVRGKAEGGPGGGGGSGGAAGSNGAANGSAGAALSGNTGQIS